MYKNLSKIKYWGDNLYRLEIFPASYGDSILVTCLGRKKTHILIDMGFDSTYKKHIKKRLLEINEEGDKLDLLILTHVDDDHISGALSFFKENNSYSKPNIISVEEIWFNSFRHLQFQKKQIDISKREEILTQNKNQKLLERIQKKARPTEQGQRSGNNISTNKGSTLASLFYFYDYIKIWNSKFQGNAIMIKERADTQESAKINSVTLNEEVEIILLSPSKNKLKKLDHLWSEKLLSTGFEGPISRKSIMDDAFEMLLANINSSDPKKREIYKIASTDIENIIKLSKEDLETDHSIINGSSIAFILTFNKKRTLFLADAHMDVVIDQLQQVCVDEGTEQLHFDAIKISHHGSKYNTSNEFLELVTSDKYIFSTNGKGSTHPDIETIFKIITSNNKRKKTLVFNYKPLHIFRIIDKKDLKEKFNYEIIFSNDLSSHVDKLVTTLDI